MAFITVVQTRILNSINFTKEYHVRIVSVPDEGDILVKMKGTEIILKVDNISRKERRKLDENGIVYEMNDGKYRYILKENVIGMKPYFDIFGYRFALHFIFSLLSLFCIYLIWRKNTEGKVRNS